MGRWTQYNEDSTRLPEGMKRIGYDADTARYTFCDREGNIYMGPAHEEYGLLSLVRKSGRSRPASPTDDRFASDQCSLPDTSESDSELSESELSVSVPTPAKTFHDLLPPHLIASPSPLPSSAASPRRSPSAESSLDDASPSPATAGSRLRDAVRRTALPAMQNAVNTVRRSATSVRKPRARNTDKEGRLRSRSVAGISE
ncbi:hypothetical protein MSAN_00748600 [Mycena sanguinolenta]|uniref:Uncharacterized protein n=1 Tax=Mycena sanguinolenta TaxID=230812 RepID=A0A8H6Z1X7_9AGAR|nr:hypothetical protein MSAN_00748600 [Mycena sanguinolenta]